MEMNNNLNVKPTQKKEPLFFIPMIAMAIYAIWNLVNIIDNLKTVVNGVFVIANFVSNIAVWIFVVGCLLFFLNKKEAKICVYIVLGITVIGLIIYFFAALIEYGVLNGIIYTIISLIQIIPFIFLALSVKNNGQKFLIPTIAFEAIILVFTFIGLITMLINYSSSGYLLLSFEINQLMSFLMIAIHAVAVISLPVVLRSAYNKANPKPAPAFVMPVQPAPQYRPVQPAPQYRPVQPVPPVQPAPQYRPVQPVPPVQPAPQYRPAQPVQPVQQEKSALEKELSALKMLLDQGLLTQEEYDKKRIDALEKHNF